MLIRLPWLITRRRLLIAVLIDIVIFVVSYSYGFQMHYGSWPVWSPALMLLLLFWLVTSYVQGRYYDFAPPRTNAATKQAMHSLGALFIILAAYLSCNWILFDVLNRPDSSTFLLPFLALQAGLSAIAQYSFYQLLRFRFEPPCNWLVLGPLDSVHALQKAASLSRLPCQLLSVQPAGLMSLANASNPAGVVVIDPDTLPPTLVEQLLEMQSQGVEVLSTLGWCERVLQRFPPPLLSPTDLIRGEFAMSSGSIQMRLKRLEDVLLSGVLLLITSPLLLLGMLLILLEDGGPVFYSQVRSGLSGKPFRLWKLRSMLVDAEQAGAQWVRRGDPRITRVGHWLRLTRIDELPQLLAVLMGAMSLVGPRPERPEFEHDLETQIPCYRLRHGVRPGLSGWAQVNYPYAASVEDAANKLSYDLYYLRNASFWLDMLILVKTMRLVFNARGAVPESRDNS
jgi:exopolysaccharide biosynthesis polyprenyl glycosylphosphotransferase